MCVGDGATYLTWQSDHRHVVRVTRRRDGVPIGANQTTAGAAASDVTAKPDAFWQVLKGAL